MAADLPTDRLLEMLTATPVRITEATAAASPVRLSTPPAAGEWSAVEVLAHLRSCADMWGGAIVTILDEDEPTIRAVNPRTWIRSTDYDTLPFGVSFDAFVSQRSALVERLSLLPEEAWQRQATVTGAGKPLVRTVHAYAQWLARHEQAHVAQIARAATG